jgi:predicted RNase H-like HicB family nuclease
MIDKTKCLHYKGFYGSVEYCAESHMLYGELLGLPRVYAMYDGETLEALIEDFKEAVEFHILSCEYDERENAKAEEVGAAL